MLEIIQIPVLSDNYIYLIHEKQSQETAVVDPATAEPVLQYAQQRGWKINYIFNTHHHPDHVGGNLTVQEHTNCQIIGAAHDSTRIPGINIRVKEGSVFTLGAVKINVLDVPGHTVGHIAYFIPSQPALFCGDTLFSLGCGRLFEGTPEQMWHSLCKLKKLPPKTQVYCAHEYTQGNARFALTIDPENTLLQQKYQEVCRKREQSIPTVPFILDTEWAINPFLRADNPALAQRMNTEPGQATFTEIRHRKDIF